MSTVAVIIVVLVVVAVLAVLLGLGMRNRRSSQLQRRFGPEYERAVAASGDKRQAEQHLADVAHRRDTLEIRDLSDAERTDFQTEWSAVQARFVDEPVRAVGSADALLTRVMQTRGYPTDHFEERAELVAADHPDVVEHYRAAHLAHRRYADADRTAGGEDGGTEDLRQAFVHYRALFDELVGAPAAPAAPATPAAPVASATPAAPAESRPAQPAPADHVEERR